MYAATSARPAAAATEMAAESRGSSRAVRRGAYWVIGTFRSARWPSRITPNVAVLPIAESWISRDSSLPSVTGLPLKLTMTSPGCRPARCRRRVPRESGDHDARCGVGHAELLGQLRRERSDLDVADRAAPDFAVLLQLAEDLAGEVARHGEADALVAAALAEDRRVDADQLAARVDERAAGVAGIDRGVGLDEVLVRAPTPRLVRPIADTMPERDGLIQLIRVADRQHPLRDLQLRRIAPRHRRQVARVDLQQREVGGRIDADDLGRHLALVGERRP